MYTHIYIKLCQGPKQLLRNMQDFHKLIFYCILQYGNNNTPAALLFSDAWDCIIAL